MAAWSRRDGMGGGNYARQMAMCLSMIASGIGMETGGISSEMVDQMKRNVASSDCDGSNVMDMDVFGSSARYLAPSQARIAELLDRMTEDSDKEEHLGPLHDAARAGKMDVCKHLVENLGFDVDVRANDGSGKTPLTCAVSCGKVIAVRYLIAMGADLDKQDAIGFTPLHYAAKRGYSGIACLLLSRGANVDVDSSEGTPLHVSAACGKFGVVEILLEHHANPDRVSPDLCTPMAKMLCATYEKASASTCLKCMKLLVKAGADLNSTNPDTPLVIATSKGLNECVDYLLEVGADANIPIKHGSKTPIEIAAKSGRRKLVESLFPFTSPIQTISDWSVEGILAYARSRQSKHKNKLSDEDRKGQLKLHGGQAVKEKDYAGALKLYTEAIMLDPADATLYSNRSFCHLKIGAARDALVDANACIGLQPDWPKAYYRKGAALMSLKEYKEARDAFMEGLKLDPSNLDIQNAYGEAEEAMIKNHSTGQSVEPLE